LAKVAADIQTLVDQAGQKNRTRFRNAVLKPLIECGLLEATIPDKAQSRKQKYRLTAMGRAILEKEGLQ
jgi:ATP-dependent DNA helicase RecG